VSADPALAIQKAVVAALLNQTAAGANVFDTVPSTARAPNPYPRITIGEATVAGNFADCYDGSETTITVNVWSLKPGFPEAKAIQGQVRALLHDADLALDGHTLDLIWFESAVALRDPDGLTSHVAMTFRVLTHSDEFASG
jgi:Protein of unknown function (DUF3168)